MKSNKLQVIKTELLGPNGWALVNPDDIPAHETKDISIEAIGYNEEEGTITVQITEVIEFHK